MFGYVKVAQPELKIKELIRYRAYYCGVCRAMSNFTLAGRSMLTYDLAFYALLTDPYAKAEIIDHRCKLNLKKRPYAQGESIDYAAALNMLLVYHKCLDDIRDGEAYKKVAAALFKGAHKRAGKKAEEAEEKIRQSMDRLVALEAENCTKIDKIAHEFAQLCAELCSSAPGITEQDIKQVVHYIGYHTARWVYIIDAFNDIEQDRRTGNYNPVLAEAAARGMEEREIRPWVQNMLFDTLYEAGKGINLLPDSPNTPILDNIINLGLHDQTMHILKEKD